MTPPTCERCNSTGEATDDPGEWLCPRCGVWIAIDGAELGPQISFEQARERYEAFAIKTAARIMEEAKRLGITQTPAARFEQLHDLYAPLTMNEAGEMVRDPANGLISRDEFLRMLDAPDVPIPGSTSAKDTDG